VRRNVERLRLPADLRPTVSIGAISLQDTMMSSAQALESADAARDRVAREGGNGVQVAPA
jgi:GGDEF domain-containing protein